MKSKIAPPAEGVDLIIRMYELSDTMGAAITDVLTELDLTHSQASMLWALEPNAPAMSMRELARKLRFDPSNVTLMTDRLVAAGLVERQVDPHDGRQRILVLTKRGLTVWELLIRRIQERSPIFSLSTSEQAQLLRLLVKAQAKKPLI